MLPAPAPEAGGGGTSMLALATVGSIGFHELFVNGQRASPDVLSPAVSDLAKRVLLRTYDVSSLLLPYPHNNTDTSLSNKNISKLLCLYNTKNPFDAKI